MSNLAADKVLRVNCPGFGVSSTLPLGEAKPLAMYEVIVINPVSIVHLFEPKSDLAAQIEKLIGDGSTSLKLDDDSQLENISAELELREHELRQFLSKGGLLVYFLAPPFSITGPSMQMDNYLWLYEWAPDKRDGASRNMSATISGKNIDLNSRGKQHPFAPYLEQLGLEWSTIIRDENLGEGYKSMAGAGGSKCVAGYKSSGPKRGQVLFLPAPYDTRFDDTLKECIQKWYEIHTGPDADAPEPEIADDAPAPASAGAAESSENMASVDDLFGDKPKEGGKKGSLNWPEFDNDVPPFAKEREKEKAEAEAKEKAKAEEKEKAEAKEKADAESLEKEKAEAEAKEKEKAKAESEEKEKERAEAEEREKAEAKEKADVEAKEKEKEKAKAKAEAEEREKAEAREKAEKAKDSEPPPKKESRSESLDSYSSGATHPEAKDLMSRLEQELSGPNVPEWCSKVSFAELKQLETEMNDLHEQIRKAKNKMSEVEDRIRNLLDLKNSLLSLSGVRLNQACSKVFETLGWNVQISEDSTDELWLKEGDKMHAIVRIVYASGQPNRSEVAELSQSVVAFWDKHDVEPKGVLLCSTYADRPPKHRTEEDFPTSLGEFAKRKNLCLLTCMQLLTMYRDIAVADEDRKKIRENILTTSGVLEGFKIDLWEATPAGR